MAWLHIRHRVQDFNRWKEIYDASAGFKSQYGWKRYRVFAVGNDRNDLLVMEEFNTVEDAQRLVQSKDFANALDLAGVQGQPEILYLQGLEEGRP
jgi:hypothetical protein